MTLPMNVLEPTTEALQDLAGALGEPVIMMAGPFPQALLDKEAAILAWCDNQLSARPISDGWFITFATVEDAALFRLFWEGAE